MRENRELCDDRNHYYIDLNTPTSQTCPLKIDLTQLINNKEIHPVSSTRTLRKKKKETVLLETYRLGILVIHFSALKYADRI